MRKVTKDAARALFARRAATLSSNTKVEVSGDTSVLLLHGNPIAAWDGEALQVTLAGWDTLTTRDRLAGVLSVGGFHNTPLVRRKGVTYLGGEPFPTGWVAL